MAQIKITNDDFKHPFFKTSSDIIKNAKRILVWGDEDADGITAAAIMVRSLRKIGKTVVYYIPSRTSDGIGLSKKALLRFVKKRIDAVITVDCGVVNVKEIEMLKSMNINVIITDHHLPHSELVKSVPYLNPHIIKNVKFNDLSGAGVSLVFSAYLLKMMKICGSFEEAFYNDPKNISLASFGTKCDRVKLNGLNKNIMEYYGSLKYFYPSILKSEYDDSEICGIIASSKTMRGKNIFLEILLNECGYNIKEMKELKMLAEKSKKYRNDVSSKYKSVIDKISKQKTGKILVYVDKKLDYKYIGVIASRLSDKTGKPVIIIGNREKVFTGECRAKSKYDFVKLLKQYSKYFMNWGGHKQAAGFSINGDKIEEFIDDFNSDNY